MDIISKQYNVNFNDLLPNLKNLIKYKIKNITYIINFIYKNKTYELITYFYNDVRHSFIIYLPTENEYCKENIFVKEEDVNKIWDIIRIKFFDQQIIRLNDIEIKKYIKKIFYKKLPTPQISYNEYVKKNNDNYANQIGYYNYCPNLLETDNYIDIVDKLEYSDTDTDTDTDTDNIDNLKIRIKYLEKKIKKMGKIYKSGNNIFFSFASMNYTNNDSYKPIKKTFNQIKEYFNFINKFTKLKLYFHDNMLDNEGIRDIIDQIWAHDEINNSLEVITLYNNNIYNDDHNKSYNKESLEYFDRLITMCPKLKYIVVGKNISQENIEEYYEYNENKIKYFIA